MLMLDFGPTAPDRLYFWQLGATTAAPTALPAAGAANGDLRQPTGGVFKRDYTNASVLVNASASAKTVSLSSGNWTVIASNPNGATATASIRTPAYDARILFKT
jgi:hypothetical protein